MHVVDDDALLDAATKAADHAALVDAAVAAERARWRMMLAGPHLYLGDCPDWVDWDARDPECPACQSLLGWRGVTP